MTQGSGGHGTRRSLLTTAAFLLLAGLLSTAPAAAHTFTRNDANDSPSKIDLKAVSVSHTATGVVHKVQTHNAWTPASLQHDSFFLIGINKDDDARYERCAFIYFTSRLRGQLSNCGSQFIRFLPVAKLNGTTAKITVPKAEVGGAYRWYGSSFWVGAAPCRNVCADFAPNTLPDILHDMIKPQVVVDPFPELSTEFSATTVVPIGFTSTDLGGSGVDTWKIQSSPPGTLPYTTRATGTGGGATVGNAVFPDGGDTYDVRVWVTDKQGNAGTSATRRLIIPDDDAATGMVYGGTWVADATDVEYFQATHHTGDAGDTVTFTVTGENLSIISGPGHGTVHVHIESEFGPVDNTMLLGDTGATKRGVIYSLNFGAATDWDITLTVEADSSFVFDGVASLET